MEKKIFYEEPSAKDVHYIFRASRTVNGEKIYARDYGLKAFRIPVRY